MNHDHSLVSFMTIEGDGSIVQKTKKVDKERSHYGPTFAWTSPCVLMVWSEIKYDLSIIPQIYLAPTMGWKL